MTSTPTPNIRLTISVKPEVHAAFQRIAQAGSMSISRAMGEWLGDTLEAAELVASSLERARSAPKLVVAEMNAYALGLADETGALLEKMREKGRAARVGASAPIAEPDSIPPSSNTGGKGPQTTVDTSSRQAAFNRAMAPEKPRKPVLPRRSR